jgi:hypothetical protein
MAAYTWVGVTDNWSTGTNWLPIAPAGGPTSADTATINNAQPCTVTANSSCLTIVLTGYTSTFKINNGFTLTVFGTAITLAAGMTYDQTTTGILSTRGNQLAITITFAGITIPNLTSGKTTAATVQTVTISGVVPTVKNFVCLSSTSNASLALAGASLTITNSFAIAGGVLTGITPTFSGSVNMTQTGGVINTGFTVSTGSTLTLGSDITSISGNITFAAGSFLVAGTFTLTITSTCTLDSSNVTWYNIHTTSGGHTITLNSDLNISNNLTWSFTGFSIGIVAATVKTITVQGSVTSSASYSRTFVLSNIILNLVGTGTFAVAWITPNASTTCAININTSNPTGYIIGSSTFTGGNSMQLIGLTFTLVGTSVASAFSSTTLYLGGGSILDTNRTSIGGSNPIYGAITALTLVTFITDTTCLGNLTLISLVSGAVVNGGKVSFGGNLLYSISVQVLGTATFEFIGSTAATWSNGTYQNNIIVNKTSGAVVTAGTAITWGAAGRTLTINTAVDFLTNSTTFTLAGATLTINNSIGSSFFNLTPPVNTVLTLGGATTPIASNLTLNGSATFTGTFGWTCKNLIFTAAGTFTITLQQAVTYRTTSAVSITGGTNAARTTMRSSLGGTDAIWTLDFGATQSLIYVNGTDIDSSGGQTIWSFGVSPANVSTSINWNPGVPLRTVAYTFVN